MIAGGEDAAAAQQEAVLQAESARQEKALREAEVRARIEAESRERQRREEEARAEALLRAASPMSALVADIGVKGAIVTVVFPEPLEPLRLVVRALGFEWNQTCWHVSSQSPLDLAVETAHRLLGVGVHVRLFDPELRRRAVSGDFVRKPTRVISFHGETRRFRLLWGAQEQFYEAARRLRGSRYRKPYVTVPVENWEEVEDFAALYAFVFTANAREAVRMQREAVERALVVEVAAEEAPCSAAVSRIPPVLVVPESIGIAPDLLDEEEGS